MKNLLFIGFIILFSLERGYGQTCRYNVIFNPGTNLYEAHMYVVTAYTNPLDAYVGPSAFSIVIPSLVSNVPVTKSMISSLNPKGAVWSDNTPVFAPDAAPLCDFHKFSTMGAKFNQGTNLSPGADILLFTFQLPSSVNADDVRIFANWDWETEQATPDPVSSAPGMQGGDFRNSFQTLKAGETYLGSAKRAITKVITLEDSSGISLWPNPTPGPVNIDITRTHAGDTGVRVFDAQSREVFSKTYDMKDRIKFDLSGNATGSYMVEVNTGGEKTIFKLILDRK